MPRVFRQQYTRPIPSDAKRVTIKGKNGKPDRLAVRFQGPDGKTVIAPLTKGGDRCRVPSPVWYGQYTDSDGVRQRVPLCENKAAAEAMLGELIHKAGLGRVGIRDPFEAHRKRPLAEHLSDYRRELASRGNAPRYVGLVVSRLRSLLDGCGFVFIGDLSASRAADWLAELRRKFRPRVELPAGQEWFTAREAGAVLGMKSLSVGTAVRRHRLEAAGQGKARRFPRATVEALQDRFTRGVSVQTTNDYLSALKSFGRWLVKDRRAADNPFVHLAGGNAKVDRRHDRRELEAEELRRLLAVTRASERVFRGLTGPDRFALYATACGTGFRASALASLTPESFDLSAELPTVTLAARHAKNRKTKVQPLPEDLAELLRAYLAGRPGGQPVWGGTWARDRKGAEMLRPDLGAAGIPYAVEGPDGPLYADFHALRHTYLTLGGRAGIDLRTLQELAGHSSPNLTARYSHRRLHDLAGAVERLPNFLPGEAPGTEAAALRATGTDGAAAGKADKTHPQLARAYTPLTQPTDGGGLRVRLVEGPGAEGGGKQPGPNPLSVQGVEAGCEPLRAVESRAGDGARTHDSHVGNVKTYQEMPGKQGRRVYYCTVFHPNS
jgi:integrase